MRQIAIVVAAFFYTCYAISAFAATHRATTPAELTAAIAASSPGDTITLADGTWRDARIEITKGGSENEPLTLKAETPGGVVLTSNSLLLIAAPHVIVDGLFFHRAVPQGARSLISINADHCRLINTAVVDCNPPEVRTGYYWVFFEGNHNRVDHCYFSGKTNQQPLVGNQIRDSRHNRVDHCFFKDFHDHPDGGNGREVFRIWGTGGSEELGEDGAFFTIENNLFDHADGESTEIISLKSNHNKVIGNTIRATRGGIVNRSGNYNTYRNNVVLGEGRRGCSGMRLTGQHHVVENNYISDCTYGIMLVAGEFIETSVTAQYSPIRREGTPLGRVPRYGWVREMKLINNTIVNSGGPDLIVGGNYKSGWPDSQRFLLPEECTISNNLFIRSTGSLPVQITERDAKPPLDAFTFKPNIYTGNTIKVGGGVLDGFTPPEGFEVVNNPGFVSNKDGLLNRDASGLAPGPGADEKQLKVLTPGDVGPEWVRARRAAADPIFPEGTRVTDRR